MQLSLNQIAIMCEGELSAGSDGSRVITNVVIDSREVADGSLFVAIVGENNDGHKYALDCLSNKALGAIVNKTSGLTAPNLVIVPDTTYAIGLLASRYRDMFNIPLVAITGSNGKTTIKEMLRGICEAEYGISDVLASKNSFNNQWGMPLTLLQLNDKHKVAIIEMGMNHHGELDYLTKLAKPTIAVVNNVLLSHAGFFKNIEEIANAKCEIYNGLVDDGVALINKNISYATTWSNKLKQNYKIKLIEFGDNTTGCYLKESDDQGNIVVATHRGDINLKLKVLGAHNQQNAITVIALALQLKLSTESIIKGLEAFTAYKHRLEQKKAFNGALIIDDSYNANPDSVKASILAIKNLPKPHWFIFGDLKELGDYATDQHIEVGRFVWENGVDMLLTIGELTLNSGKAYMGSMPNNGESVIVAATGANVKKWLHFNNNDDIAKYCREHVPENATILIKGSNSMKLWQIADLLQ